MQEKMKFCFQSYSAKIKDFLTLISAFCMECETGKYHSTGTQ